MLVFMEERPKQRNEYSDISVVDGAERTDHINHSIVYSSNIPGKVRLNSVTAESMFNSTIHKAESAASAMGCDGVYRGKAKSKRCVFRRSLKVVVVVSEWTDSGAGVIPKGRGCKSEWQCPYGCVGRDPGN